MSHSQDEDKVEIKVYSKELGVNLLDEITTGLAMGDSAAESFSFVVPQGLAAKTYVLGLSSEYDYRSGNYMRLSSDSFPVTLKVFGCTPPSTEVASITASMESDKALVGQQLQIKSTITNTQATNATFVLNANNFESWASLDSVSEKVFTLKSGESRDVTLTFNIKSDATVGQHSFNIATTSNSKTESREVAVNIEKSSFLSSILPSSLTTGNSILWILGVVIVILIILIIVVAVKLARR